MEDVRSMRLLFVPGEITTREHCFDRVEPLTKHPANPVLVGDRPWEKAYVAWPSVLYSEREEMFKMWYYVNIPPTPTEDAAPGDGEPLVDDARIYGTHYLCYAYSKDGIDWHKPALGRVDLPGYPDNNMLFSDAGFLIGIVTVIEDLKDPDPARRYKLLMYDNDGAGRDGGRTAVSPNGIDWQFIGDFPVLPTQDTPTLWYDRQRGRYVAFLKTRLDNRRALMVSVSKDFFTWSEPSVLLSPDLADSPTLHFYAHNAFHHCGHDLGFLNRYELCTQRADLELVVNRRGVDTVRLPTRPVVLGPGDPGSWDSGGVYTGLGKPIERGDTCWIYYYGSGSRHDESGSGSGFGIATFTKGRLVGQQFVGEGWFSSAPFRCPGGTLALDAIARQPVTVEVCSTGYGDAFPAYSQSECEPVRGDSQEHAIRWRSRLTLDEFRGAFIQLKVYGRDSVVYGASFR